MKPRDPGPASSSGRFALYLSYALLVAGLLVTLFVRFRFLSVPLERDEGEYAYAGQLILSGLNPYHYCYTMKLPGTAAAYAIFMALFGQYATAIHLELLLVNTGTVILCYLLARRLMGPLAGAVAGLSFAALSLGAPVLGLAGHATQFVMLAAMGGTLLLLKAVDSKNSRTCFLSGLLFGLSFVMKQQGVFFIFFGLGYLFYGLYGASRNLRLTINRTAIFMVGAVLPFALTCFLFFASGSFAVFWFWVFDYAGTYGMIVQWYDAVILLKYQYDVLLQQDWPLMALSILGFIALLWHRPLRRHAIFILSFSLFSLAAFSAGLHFRRHYFVLMLPAISLLCACGIEGLMGLWRRRLTVRITEWAALPLFVLTAGGCLFLQKDYLFAKDPVQAFTDLYYGNPFGELVPIAAYIKEHSVASDRLVVMGSDPELYFYTGRRSATGYIYMYPLMEEQPFASHMQKEMIREIEDSRPKFMVFITTRLSWLVFPASDKSVIAWSEHYVHDHYKLVGLSDNVNGTVELHWQDAEHYVPRSPYTVYIFERRD